MPTNEDYIKFFKEADTDGSGELTLEELKQILRKNGYRKTDREIQRMFNSVDTSKDGKISMQEYLSAMKQEPTTNHKEAAMRSCFEGFDKNGDGTIDKNELQAVWKEMGRHLSREDLNRVMKLVDADGSGSIDYEEFIAAVFGKTK